MLLIPEAAKASEFAATIYASVQSSLPEIQLLIDRAKHYMQTVESSRSTNTFMIENIFDRLTYKVTRVVDKSEAFSRGSTRNAIFLSTVGSAYWFLAPVHNMRSKSSRLQYAAKLAREEALLSMGSFAAEMCLPSCLPLILAPPSDFEVEASVHLLREFIQFLKPQAAKSMLLPSIQKFLQSAESSHLKVTLLQIPFKRDLWKLVGLQVYLEYIRPLVIKNLYISYDKNSAAAASVLLVGSYEEIGTPITIHQTILLLMQCFYHSRRYIRNVQFIFRRTLEQSWIALPISLSFCVQPDEAIYLKINNKVPGLGMRPDRSNLNLHYAARYSGEIPDAYERLLLDAIEG